MRAAHTYTYTPLALRSEQRDRNGEEREVVVHRDREDARQRQLDHQNRAGDAPTPASARTKRRASVHRPVKVAQWTLATKFSIRDLR